MDELKMLLLPLQFFAEEGSGEGTGDSGSTDPGSTEEGNSDKLYTKSELDSAISKAVDASLKRKEKEFQKLLDKAISDGVAKGKTYSELTEEQKRLKDVEEKEQKLLAKEKELITRERLSDITADLIAAGLPNTLANILVIEESDEKVKEAITSLKTAFESAVNDRVKESLRQESPKSGGAAGTKQKSIAEAIAEDRNKKSKSSEGYDPWATK